MNVARPSSPGALSRFALVSDLHLGRGLVVGQRPGAGAALRDALEALARRVDRVLLVGDLFELHHGPLPLAFARELRCARRRHPALVTLLAGPRFVRLVGNHDRALARLSGHHEDLRLDVGGRRLVVLHGHQLDLLHTHAPRLEAAGSWAANALRSAGLPAAWSLAMGVASRLNGMHRPPATAAFTRRLLAWGRARGATWIAHGHDHEPLLLTRDGVTLVRPGATTATTLRYALLDVVSGEASLHAQRL